MPMGFIEYVEPILEQSKTNRNEYHKKYYYIRQQAILNQRKNLYHQKKQIAQIEVDFTKK